MSLDLGALALRLTVDNQIPAGLRTAERQLQQAAVRARRAGQDVGEGFGSMAARHLGGAAGKVGGAVGRIGGLLAKVGPWAALGFGAVGAAGGAMGVKVASGNEQAKISFTTMLGSAQKANVFLRQLQKFAAATPFEFPELQTAASSLISVGVKAKDVIPIMTSLGNTTSGMGTGSEGIKRATVALQQMNAAGKIQAEDLNQLRDAGIPVYDLLAASLGKSKKQIADMVSSGDLAKMGQQPVDALMAGLKTGKGLERFSGLMEKQSHSLAGMVSTLKDTVGQGLANAVAPAFPLIKQGLESISSTSASLFKWVGKNKSSLSSLFSSAGATLKTFGTISSTIFRSFISSFGDGRATFKSFADFIATHQADITNALVTGGKAALGLGRTIATSASSGLRGLGSLSDASVGMTTIMLATFSALAHGAAETWGWIPGLGPKLKAADAGFAAFAKTAVAGMRGIGPGARQAADAIDKNVVPAIDKAQKSLDKVGNTEIAKARFRDSAAKAGLAIRAIGTDANGSQIHLKHFNDITDLASGTQKGLRSRLSDARQALRDQINAMQDANVGQGKLTKAWETGKDRLYREFLQMGLSRGEAKKLAAQYAGFPPKKSTKIDQPGMTDAQKKAKNYNSTLGDIPPTKKTTATLTFKNNAGTVVANLNKTFQLVKGGPKMQFAVGGRVRGPGTETSDDVPIMGSNDEFMVKARSAKKIGYDKLDYMNRTGQIPLHLADGGRVSSAADRAQSREGTSGSQMYGWAVKKKIEGAMKYARDHGGDLGDPAHVSNPSGHTSFRGGTFTRLFAAGLQAAERDAGRHFAVYQGGFRPSTSYSGSTHNKDAIDAHVDYALLRAFRRHVGAMGDRTGLGNWAAHMHGVPAPGHGYGSPSAQAQYRDYVRRGGASQSPRSPWGLWTGTASAPAGFAWTGEKGGELVVNPQLRKYRGGEGVLNNQQTEQLFADAEKGKGKDWRGSPLIGNYQQVFPQSMDPMTAAAAAGSMTVAKLRAVAVGR